MNAQPADDPGPLEPPGDDGMPDDFDPYQQPDLRVDDGEDWPEPQPLLRYASAIPTDALGPILGPMVGAVAHTYQAPSDIAVTMGLPVITTAAAGRWNVKIRDGWTESLSLATLSILGSSGGKSGTLKTLVEPLRVHETEAMEAGLGDFARSKAELEMLKDRADKLRVDIKNTADHNMIEGSEQHAVYREKQQRYIDVCEQVEQHKLAALPRWMVDDATPEALLQVMDQQDGAIGVISAEAGIIATLGGRYSSGQANLDVVLKGVSGDRIQNDRKTGGAPPVVINHPVLSISLGIQPGLMRRLGEKPEFRESGFLGRFLPVMPPSIMGARLIRTTGIPDDIHDTWWRSVRNLAATAQQLRRSGRRRTLTVKPDAEDALDEFRSRMEPEFLEGGRLEHLVDFGGKLAGAAVRIAGALTLLADPEAEQIETSTMRDALRVADAYIAHAHVAFGTLGGGDPNSPKARVVAWLIDNREAVVAHRDVHYAFKKKPWARTSKDVLAVMEALEELGYVHKGHRSAAGSSGGRKAVVWHVNPAVFSKGRALTERLGEPESAA